MKYKVYEDIHDKYLLTDWNLLQSGNDMTAFQHVEWMEVQDKSTKENRIRHLFGKIEYFEVLDEDNTPVAIAPLYIVPHHVKIGLLGYEKGIYLLGQKSYSDYLNLIYREIDKKTLSFIVSSVINHYGIERFFITQLRSDTKLCQMILHLRGLYEVAEVGSENCVQMHLPATIEEFRSGLSKNLVSNLKKQRNRYKREGFSLSVRLIKGICKNRELLDRINEIHNDRFQQKNGNNIRIRIGNLLSTLYGCMDEISYAMQHNHESWLLLGYYGENIVSYIYGLEDKKAIRIMQLGFDGKYQKYMPGIMSLLSWIESNYDTLSGSWIDFTRGEERYKYELGGKQHTIYDYCITCH